ncbi:ALDH-like protein [Penicillium malachiteum]|uniref:ALDH-like protein n=1 Tax=Penicillium malachiteum TaxID=1324776 RepID=UPI002546A71A|nr:ALDH-like protein [Penicillium malachiteum]KAJ5728880.1 ALDH-like protein [Penicillium malachiteum]
MTLFLQSIREASVDGRMQNVLYRQDQFEKLHRILVQHGEHIQKTMVKDGTHTDTEAKIEYFFALRSLKEYYETLDSDKALHQEYAISRGEDSPAQAEPIGIVYVAITEHTVFYSTIAAICAALAAGNCVVIQVRVDNHYIYRRLKMPTESELFGEVSTLIRQLLADKSLDRDVIAVVVDRPSKADLGPNHIRVFQNPLKTQESLDFNHEITSPSGCVIAIVDRTADLDSAAQALVAARFSFGGTSPYAPDIILVNEFVKRPFLAAVTNAMVSFLEDRRFDSRIPERTKPQDDSLDLVAALGQAELFEVTFREFNVIQNRNSSRRLLVHGVRSLDDAIDLANGNRKLIASYIFADLVSAKYLTQFITTHVSFVNQIPLELLIGPAAPQQIGFDRSLRYPISLFSQRCPAFVTSMPFNDLLQHTMQGQGAEISHALMEISKALKPSKPRPNGGGVGFFEQGILIGLALFGIPILVSVGFLGTKGAQYVSRLL